MCGMPNTTETCWGWGLFGSQPLYRYNTWSLVQFMQWYRGQDQKPRDQRQEGARPQGLLRAATELLDTARARPNGFTSPYP